MLKGHLDMIVLAALAAGPAHGYAVIEEIKRRSGQKFDLPEGTVYPGAASPRAGRPARQPLGHRRKRAAAAGLCADQARRARARRPARGVAAIFRRDRRLCSGERGHGGTRRDLRLRRIARGQAQFRPLAGAMRAAGSRGPFVRGRRGRSTAIGSRRERRAIANFGDPHVIAAQFAVISLAEQTRKVGATVVLVVAGVFLA